MAPSPSTADPGDDPPPSEPSETVASPERATPPGTGEDGALVAGAGALVARLIGRAGRAVRRALWYAPRDAARGWLDRELDAAYPQDPHTDAPTLAARLGQSLGEASVPARKVLLLHLSLCAYALLTLLSVKDRDFYGAHAFVKLPVVGVEVPPSLAFLALPLVLLAIFGYLQIFLGHIERIRRRLARLADDPAAPLQSRVDDADFASPWIASLAAQRGVFGGLVRAVYHLIIWLAVPGVILLYWARLLVLRSTVQQALKHGLPPARVVGGVAIAAALIAALWSGARRVIDARFGLASPLGWRGLFGRLLAVGAVATLVGGQWRFQRALCSSRAELDLVCSVNLRYADFSINRSEGSRETGVRLEAVDLEHADLASADLRKAWLRRANLRHANLAGASLDGADLGDADLGGAVMLEASLDGASLFQTRLEDADLRWAHLNGANLLRADLRRARLGSAIGEGAHLREAHLEGANLDGASLEGADLGGAHLEGADLRNAHLSAASLAGSQLFGADLRGAELYGVDLRASEFFPDDDGDPRKPALFDTPADKPWGNVCGDEDNPVPGYLLELDETRCRALRRALLIRLARRSKPLQALLAQPPTWWESLSEPQ